MIPVSAAPTRRRLNKGASWLGTVRGRLGFTTDAVLIYGTGGLAFGGVKTFGSLAYADIPDQGENNLPVLVSFSKSATKWGWAIGAGAEYALTSKISAKVEYLHYDLGNVTADLVTAVRLRPRTPASVGSTKASISGDLARVGLNYKF